MYINYWIQFCSSKNIDSKLAEAKDIVEFLTELFYNKKLSYSAINSARSALSSYVVLRTSTVEAGAHPVVSKFMRGVFNLRPPKPRYQEVWDVRVVLNCLRKLSPAGKLSLKALTIKTVTLIALISAQRVQTLQKLSLKTMKVKEGSITFCVDELLKQSRPGTIGCKIRIQEYPPDRRLCPLRYMKAYLKKTSELRNAEEKVFISLNRPHKEVSTATIARWIKIVLKQSGIDIGQFSAHSTRAASTSAARKAEIPVDVILSAAGWASERTFAKFYHKPRLGESRFAEAVLQAGSR